MATARVDTTGPVRATEAGRVAGVDGDILVFRGIPYAAPPVGQRRWRSPAPPQRWAGVRQAGQFGADCYGDARLRAGSLAPSMSEDCLYLNVWTPREGAKAGLPVMVWVYGGGFTGGTAAMPYYDGAALARKNVVVVTLNYRTNIFGFFAHPALSAEDAHEVSGNYGLLDILAALRWVHRNIGGFGGDPSKITVFGESAGASALGLLLTSPPAHGLFRQAILESPGLVRPLATLRESSASGKRLGDDLSKLRSLDAASLMALAQQTMPAVRSLRKPRPIGPIVDGWLVPRTDKEAIEKGLFARVPLVIGSNADEGRLFTRHMPVRTIEQYGEYLRSQFGDDAAEMARCYPARSDEEVPHALARVFGDDQFIRGIDAFSAAWSRWKVPVWRYRFDGLTASGRPPATHAEEIPFVFGAPGLNVFGPSPAKTVGGAERLGAGEEVAPPLLSEAMSTAWTAFAGAGDPNNPTLPHWPRFSPGGSIMTFGQRIEAASSSPDPITDACAGRAGDANAKP